MEAMENVIDISQLNQGLFVQVALVRDIRKATIEQDGSINIASPLGFSEVISKAETTAKFTRLDGKKIRLAAWSRKQTNFIMTPARMLWYACYVPPKFKVRIAGQGGKPIIANMTARNSGDYIVCPSTPNGKPDMSRLYIVTNQWFHRMFGFTAVGEEQAKKIRANGVGKNREFAEPIAVKPEKNDEVLLSAEARPARKPEAVADKPKVNYPTVRKNEEAPNNVTGATEYAFIEYTGTKVCFRNNVTNKIVILDTKADSNELCKFTEEHKVSQARVGYKITDENGKLQGFVIFYGTNGRSIVSTQNLMRLVKANLVYNVSIVERDGKMFVRGYNGFKLSDLPLLDDGTAHELGLR